MYGGDAARTMDQNDQVAFGFFIRDISRLTLLRGSNGSAVYRLEPIIDLGFSQKKQLRDYLELIVNGLENPGNSETDDYADYPDLSFKAIEKAYDLYLLNQGKLPYFNCLEQVLMKDKSVVIDENGVNPIRPIGSMHSNCGYEKIPQKTHYRGKNNKEIQRRLQKSLS